MELDDRELFLGFIQREILGQYNDLPKAIKKAEDYSLYLDNVVRNFYELEGNEDLFPLFALSNLKKEGRDNFGFSEKEFNDRVIYLTKKVNNLKENN